MNKQAFLEQYQAFLATLERTPADASAWVALARHIDGRELNYEECLASREELAKLDANGRIAWSKFIWEQVRELFPDNLEALENLIEYQIDIAEDTEGAATHIDELLALAPLHPQGLHFAVYVAQEHEDLEAAKTRMLQLCEVSPETAVARGTFDYFDEDELEFLAPLAPGILAVIDTFEDPSGYERNLRRLIESLPHGGPSALKRLDAAFVPAGVDELPIKDLRLPFSPRKFLDEHGATTVRQVVSIPAEAVRTCPLSVVQQLREALEAHGVEFVPLGPET